jgi:hypothetical protein
VTIEQYTLVGTAKLAQQYLEERDIRAYLADDQILDMDWMLGAAVGGVKVQVAEPDAVRAKEILDELRKKRNGPDNLEPVEFKCDECYGILSFPGNRRGGVESCKHCGCYVDVPSGEEDDEFWK